MDFLYHLNIDPPERVIESFNKLNNQEFNSTVIHSSLNETINENYHRYLGLNWNNVSIHIKTSGVIGSIHRDNWKNKNLEIWAINWVWGSDGIMNYWTKDQVTELDLKKDDSGQYRINCSTNYHPYKSYHTPTGAYLVNISEFHQVNNIGKSTRFAVSLRCDSSRLRTWKNAVDYFKNSLKVI